MRVLLREAALLAVAGLLSWWVLLRQPSEGALPEPPQQLPLSVSVLPLLEQTETEVAQAAQGESEPAAPSPAPDPPVDEPQEQAPRADELEDRPDDDQAGPPPPESGTPDGDPEAVEDGAAAAAGDDEVDPAGPQAQREETGAHGGAQAEDLMRSPELLEDARRELEGDVRRGFRTVLFAAPESQLDIARFFGEELVLVPRSTLNPELASPWFRLDLDGIPSVERVSGPAPLEGYRQYRDLFEYEYARLPAPLKKLRHSVMNRNEVYLFAAMIPLAEWAVVVGRRRDALAQTARALSDVSRFVLKYRRRSDGGFDLHVQEILFADGSRYIPTEPNQGG